MNEDKTDGLLPELTHEVGWSELTADVEASGALIPTYNLGAGGPPNVEHDDAFITDLFDAAVCGLGPIDFKAAAGLGSAETLKTKHKLVVIIDEVLAKLAELGSGLLFIAGCFYCFVGTHWKKVAVSTMRRFLDEASQRLGLRMVEARYFRFLDELVKQLSSVGLAERVRLSASVHMVNFLNFTVEINSGTLTVREHRMSDLITYVLPWPYDPVAECPMFQHFLEKLVPDKISRANLAEFAGWLFLRVKLEKALFLLGDGSNGKSTFAEIIIEVIGRENVTHHSLESLSSDYHRANLGEFLLNHSSEISRLPNSAVFKKLVSGEPIEARRPYGAAFILHDYAKLMFNCNQLPIDVEHTDAFFRRILIVRFDVRIGDDERDPDIAQKIVRDEAPGIFNWIIDGAQRLLAQGAFTSNPIAEAALKEYRLESDPVALYMNESHLAPSPSTDDRTPLGRIYEGFKSFCVENNYRQTSRRTFHRRLKSLGYASLRSNKGVIVLVREVEPEFDLVEPPELFELQFRPSPPSPPSPRGTLR